MTADKPSIPPSKTEPRVARRAFAPWADPAARPLVRFDGVGKRFSGATAVEALSLDIFEGEFFALLAFTLSVDEFIIAYFTAGAGRASTTLPMQIYAMIRFGVTPEINALATLVMLVSVTALVISQRVNRGTLTG